MLSKENGAALKAASLLNYTLIAVVLILSVSVTVLGLRLSAHSKIDKRTLIPPQIDRAFSISNAHVDNEYLALMAEWWVHLKFNVTPSNVNRQFNQLITYVPSQYWSSLQDKLLREAQFIEDNDVTSFFEINKVAADNESMKIRVDGVLNKTVGGRSLEPETVTYILQAGYPNGLIELHTIAKEVPL
ncbi:type IV conjugative transfer system protein TraE [Enterovibrio norvegicus]|uniref:Type IV conjugative transfer system protein TraE n=1 Tax=Enterovibrio norvegicus TaxID=188144 RepID=A0ABV4L539_9GAMM